MNVAIVDYGAGNLKSLERALQSLGAETTVLSSPQNEMTDFHKLILPGVGSFHSGMKALVKSGLADWIRDLAKSQHICILGICLGMHLLADTGNEGQERCEGLGLIGGTVERLRATSERERIPHMGWNEIRLSNPHYLFKDIPNGSDFYFAHSYSFVTSDYKFQIAATPYCGIFSSAVSTGHISGVQFHPEKSSAVGKKLLKNFLELKSA